MLEYWDRLKFYLTYPYWLIQYQLHAKKETGIDLDSFRKLLILVRALNRRDRRREQLLRLVFFPLRLMTPLSEILQLRWFEDLRLQYARYFQLFFYRQYLNYTNNASPPATIHLDYLENIGNFLFLHLTYENYQYSELKRYLHHLLKEYFHLSANQVQLKKLSSNTVQLLIPYP